MYQEGTGKIPQAESGACQQMDIRDFVRQAIEGRAGEIRLNCPCCGSSGGDTLCANADTGQFICHRCGNHGGLSTRVKDTSGKKRTVEKLWGFMKGADSHPYLMKKGVKAYGLKSMEPPGEPKVLAIPLYFGKKLSTIQFINEQGDKNLLSKKKGGNKKGASFQVGEGAGVSVYLCEGYATAASIFEATGGIVYMCVDAGNLLPAALNLREKYPDHEFIFCADNDTAKPKTDPSYNIGYIRAAKTAIKVGNSKVVMPKQAGYDFNDLHQAEGIETIRERLKAASANFSEFNEPENPDFDDSTKEDAKSRIQTREEFSAKIDELDGVKDIEFLTGQLIDDINKSDLSYPIKYALFKMISKKCRIRVELLASQKKDQSGDGGKSQIGMVKEIVAEIGPNEVIFANESVYRYNGKGLWFRAEDRGVKKLCQDKMKDSCVDESDITQSVVNSMLDLFKTEVLREGHKFDINRNSINVLNGELHWNDEKWEFKDHCRESYHTSQIPINYDPEAVAPRLEKFLGEIFSPDPDCIEKGILVMEMFGYCLLSSAKYEKFFILIGPGANGKSVLLSLLVAFLGAANVSAVNPTQLDNKFQRAHLLGKLANVVTELPEGAVLPDAAIKDITSGEKMTVEEKFKPPFDFEPFSTIVIATNHMPHSRDFSVATFRRIIPIPFNRVFSEKEQDKNLADKLKTELPGILNIALAAIGEVFRRGHFTETASIKEAKIQWRLETDQASQFVDECCEKVPGHREPSNRLYRTYRKWADDQGINKMLNQNNFTKRLVVLGAVPVKGTGGQREVAGFRIKQYFYESGVMRF